MKLLTFTIFPEVRWTSEKEIVFLSPIDFILGNTTWAQVSTKFLAINTPVASSSDQCREVKHCALIRTKKSIGRDSSYLYGFWDYKVLIYLGAARGFLWVRNFPEHFFRLSWGLTKIFLSLYACQKFFCTIKVINNITLPKATYHLLYQKHMSSFEFGIEMDNIPILHYVFLALLLAMLL